jgi:hypothetical protein
VSQSCTNGARFNFARNNSQQIKNFENLNKIRYLESNEFKREFENSTFDIYIRNVDASYWEIVSKQTNIIETVKMNVNMMQDSYFVEGE